MTLKLLIVELRKVAPDGDLDEYPATKILPDIQSVQKLDIRPNV